MTQLWAIISDIHGEFYDAKLFNKFCQWCVDNRPYGLIINGDFIDAHSINGHERDALALQRDADLGREYVHGRFLLAKLNQALSVDAKKVFLFGNHEDRFWRFVNSADNAKLGSALLDPIEGLRLRESGYTVLPHWKQDSYQLGSHLEVTHGIYTTIHVAKRHLDDYQGSVVVGHTHRFQSFVLGKRGGWNLGFMGDPQSKGFLYLPRAIRNRWTQSFGTAVILDGGDFIVNPVQCQGGRFYYNGKLY